MLSAVQAAGDGLDIPARHLTRIVAAFAFAAAIGVDRETAIGVALNVVDMADRRVTERIAAALIPKYDQLSQEPVEAAAARITAR